MRRHVVRVVPMVVVALIAAQAPAHSSARSHHHHAKANTDRWATRQKPAGWDEPSAIATSTGKLFIASQNPNLSGHPGDPDVGLVASGGKKWHNVGHYIKFEKGRSEGTTGDVTMTADAAGTVFVGHLTSDLQTDIDYSRDGGKTWHTANDVGPAPSPGGGSDSASLVDRPWISAYSPDHKFRHTKVYLEYHDFSTSAVYIVTCSTATGSLSCGTPVPVSNPQTGCNSIPGGVAIAPRGAKHAGRVYATWTTADPATNALSGCNYTQLAPFYALYTAWSDNPSQPDSWHQSPVYIGPHGKSQNCPGTSPIEGVSTNTCADMSELFTPVAVDRAGNVYVAFIDYISTRHRAYDVYLARSRDGGRTWDGKKDGSGKPVLVSSARGTHYTTNLVAGSRGRVAVVYYATHYTDHPFGKGTTCPTTTPPETSCQGKNKPEPAHTRWVTQVAVSRHAAARHAHFRRHRVSRRGATPHFGDICNLGIYCDGSSTGNRSLFENNSVFLGKQGCLVAAWTDQRKDPHARKDAASSDAQTKQEAYDQIFVWHQEKGHGLLAHHKRCR